MPEAADPIRIFISSVQKELEFERAAVAGLITTDPFLVQHCVPVLFEKEPPAARPTRQGYLATLRDCALYVLILANEYGQPDGDLSATHHEYREAQKLKLPTVVFVRGAKDDARSPEVRALIDEIKKDGYKYVRFHDREDLKPLMLEALRRALAEEFSLKATKAEVAESDQQIDAASTFETAVLADVPIDRLDGELMAAFNQRVGTSNDIAEYVGTGYETLHARGLAVRGERHDSFLPTAAAFVLFAPHPVGRFPQCQLLVDAYDEPRITGRPKGQLNLDAPLPRALEQALKFVDAHTFHPRRVVGLNNLRLDEYPVAALREALVNAVAHRSYEDRSRKVLLRIFSDRVEISSPGYPPRPLTLAKLRRGGYRPCSRNPLIAQTLATLGLMEQRGSGFARMREAMLNHGLAEPAFSQQDGFFVVTLPGPSGNYDRLKVPAHAVGTVTPALEAQLNARQRKMVRWLAAGAELTGGACEARFGVTRPVVTKDFARLIELGIARQVGRGRSTRYRLMPPTES
jgi:predicted HTH transcriptional regulator